LWRVCLPCAATTSGDRKKALQKVALAPAGSRGGAEGEEEAETTLVQAGKMEAKARGMRAFHLDSLMASFSRAKNLSASS
jgi:hypothetical protein